MKAAGLFSLITRMPEMLDLRGRDTADAGTLPLKRRLARGAFWAVTGTGGARILVLLASIVLARVLGKEGFGEFAMVQSTIWLFAAFAGFGMGFTATKHVAQYRVADKAKAGRIMTLSSLVAGVSGFLMAAALFFASPFLAEKVLAAPRLAPLLRISALYLFFTALNGAQNGALEGFEAFRVIAKTSVATGFFQFAFVVVGVLLAGLEGAVWGLSLSMALGWLVTHFALRSTARSAGVPFVFAGCLRERSILWTFSLPAVLSGLTYGPTMWLCNAMLVNRPGGYGEMGILNAVLRWYAIVLFIPRRFGNSAFPVLSWEKREGNMSAKDRILFKALKGALLLALAGALPVAAFSPLIMKAYGPGFESGTALLRMMCLTALLKVVADLFHLEFAALGKMWLTMGINVLWSVTLVAVVFLLVDRGAVSITAGMLIGAAVQAATGFLLFKSMGGHRFPKPKKEKI